MPDLFQKFGGHRQAAGISLHAGRLEDFRRRFGEFAALKLTVDDLRPQYEVDAEASFADLTDTSVQQIMGLGPFGFGNPCPILYAPGAEVAGPIKELKGGRHLSVPLRHNGRMLVCKAWNFGDRARLFERGAKLDVLFQVEDDPNGRKRGLGSWCVSLKDVRKN
jgi:single-stranded-DNA-specific exonuclease